MSRVSGRGFASSFEAARGHRRLCILTGPQAPEGLRAEWLVVGARMAMHGIQERRVVVE